ncbi:MAG: tripartite tricarboxylate transporter substrate binding protein [Limnohabitans sp.]|nr:MAG: tripartite tricarboxylate transporter substrate binding protein [Limnohabitans sp.]
MRKNLLAIFLGGISLLAQAAFPEKPITVVVPYPPGGATDILARKLAGPMGQRLGQPVIIENKAGAGTAIGATFVAKSAPDGYTLLISSNTTFTVNAALKNSLPYDPQKDFESVGLIGSSPLVLLAHPKVPANTVKELIALSHKDGKGLNFGSFGVGTSAHMAGEMFKVMTGANMVHVAYRGSAPAMTDLIGGQIPLTFDTSVAAMPQMATGKVKAIAVTSRQRSPQMPQVPSVAEAGFPDYEMVPWIGYVGRRGMPAEVSARLSKAIKDSLNDPAVKAELQKVGLDVLFEPGSVYDKRVAQELPLLRAYVHRANIPVE